LGRGGAPPAEPAGADPREPAEVRPLGAMEPVSEPEPVRPAQPDAVEAARPAAETVDPIDPDPVVPAQQVESVEPTERPEIVEELQAEEVEEVLPEVIAALPSPRPVVEEEQPVKKPARQAEQKKAEPKKAEPKKVAAGKTEAAAKSAARVAEKTQEAKNARSAASQSSAKSTASKAPSISPAKWQSRVIAWINRHKRYPSKSKARGDEGQVHVNFAINASGVVLSASIGRSSGSPDLDRAALDMVRRAPPVPAPPPEIARDRMQLALPVQFSMR